LAERLSGKTFMVVGAAGNLGPSWVQSLLEEGATVLALGLGVHTDLVLAALVDEHPQDLFSAELDVTQDIDLASLIRDLAWDEPGGKVDGVVFNSGIDSLPGTGRGSLEEYGRDEWDRLFQVNVIGVMATFNGLLPALGDPSSVVMLGSLYGLVSPKPELYSHFNDGAGSIKHPAYGASKAALVAAARQYGTHLAGRGIRVNTLTLGGVAAGQDPDFVEKFENHVPQAKMLTMGDIAGAMVFLLSDDSRGMTGQNVIVDGGFTAW
jgi:NAD(P)-dependent dehydrogenase (short-subunit alcohol dehydrogenase family)